MGGNYDAWKINESDFPKDGNFKDQIIFILKYAILAPSAHNTQPWSFKVFDNYVDIYIDKKRALKDSDPELRQSYESVGACLANLGVAAEYFGFITSEKEFNEIVGDFIGVKRVIFNKKAGSFPVKSKGLFESISKRHSAKLDYENVILPEDIIKNIHQYSFPEDGNELFIITEKKIISDISNIVAFGTELAFNWPEFCIELRKWVRPNWTSKSDGMPCFTMGIPTLISGIIPHLFGRVPLGKGQAKMVVKQVNGSSAVAIIVGDNLKNNWLSAGALYEKIALYLVSEGWSSAVMGAPIELKQAAEKLQTILGVNKRPIMFFRIGKQVKSPKIAPRRRIEECLI